MDVHQRLATWINLLDICRQRQITPEMIDSKACGNKSPKAVSLRRSVIQELAQRGLPRTEIAAVLRMTDRAVRKALAVISLAAVIAMRVSLPIGTFAATPTSRIARIGHVLCHRNCKSFGMTKRLWPKWTFSELCGTTNNKKGATTPT